MSVIYLEMTHDLLHKNGNRRIPKSLNVSLLGQRKSIGMLGVDRVHMPKISDIQIFTDSYI